MGDECKVTMGDHDYMKNSSDENSRIKDNKEQQPLEIIPKLSEYEIQYPIGDTYIDNQRVTFPYISTKLRAEAPPFTPDCTIVTIENPTNILHIEPNNQEYQDHCFINVNLIDDDMIHSPENEALMSKRYPIIKETIIDEDIHLLERTEVTSHPLDPISPEIEIVTNANDTAPKSSPSVAIREEIAPSQYHPRSRLILRRFNFGNTTKIAVLIASIIVSLILIVYVFV